MRVVIGVCFGGCGVGRLRRSQRDEVKCVVCPCRLVVEATELRAYVHPNLLKYTVQYQYRRLTSSSMNMSLNIAKLGCCDRQTVFIINYLLLLTIRISKS